MVRRWGILLLLLVAVSCQRLFYVEATMPPPPAEWWAQYNSYSWAEEAGTANKDHPLMDSRALHNWIMPTVDSVLQAKGWKQVHRDTAEVIVSFHFLFRSTLKEVNNSATYAQEWYQKGIYIKSKEFKEEPFTLLLIRLRQREPDKPLWAGWAEGSTKDLKQLRPFVLRATKEILQQLHSNNAGQ